jgi:GMP synthase (glutamine-hydrolysing)
MREVLVLEHTEAAGLSGFTEVLDARTTMAPWRHVHVPEGGPLPEDLDTLAGVIVMGGAMSAVDPAAYPWMTAELELLRRAVAEGVPVLGVCLGAQLLGSALGGEVFARATPEVGFLALHHLDQTRGDEVLGGWPDGAPALLIHEDQVATLPPDAMPLLTGSDGVPAWRVGDAWAVQFHPEVTPRQLRSWVDAGLLDHLLDRSGVDVDALLAEAERRGRFTVPQGRALVGRFLDGPIRRRVTA